MKTSGIPEFRGQAGDFVTAKDTLLQNEQPSISLASVIASAMAVANDPVGLAFSCKNSTVAGRLGGDGEAVAIDIIGGIGNRVFDLVVAPVVGQSGKSIQWQVGAKPGTVPQAVYDAIKALIDPVRPTYTVGALATAVARSLQDLKESAAYDSDGALIAINQSEGGKMLVIGALPANVGAIGTIAAEDDTFEVTFTAQAEAVDPTALPFEGGPVGE